MSARVQALYEHKIRKVTRAFEDGADVKKIARKVGVSPPTITRWLTLEGYKHKKRGRYPKAMKARTRDLSRRGWSDERIARLLQAPLERVIEWNELEENPILGGEKDPLKVRGGRVKKRAKKTQSKVRQYDKDWEYVRGRWRKKKKKRRKGAPPPRHKCRKKWTKDEKDYVLALMERGLSVLAIYRRMRASRKRQLKIWREAGKKGLPPGFPTPSDEPFVPIPKGARRGKITPKAKAELEALESEAAEAETRRAAIQARLEADKKAIEEAKAKRKALAAQVRKEQEQTAALEAWAARRPAVAPPSKRKRRRVQPGSYEEEELGLKVGSVIPKKALESAEKRKRVKKPKKDIVDWADNKRYFVVSRDWPMLKRMGDDELHVVAQVMADYGFPSRVEPSGDEPRAYQSGDWGIRRTKKWDRAKEGALEVLGAYKAQKKKLAATKKYDLRTAQYIAAAAKSARRRTAANEESSADAWANLGVVGQLIARFTLRIADSQGRITPQGMARSKAAERIVQEDFDKKEAKRVRKALEEKDKVKLVEEAEDELAALLGEAGLD